MPRVVDRSARPTAAAAGPGRPSALVLSLLLLGASAAPPPLSASAAAAEATPAMERVPPSRPPSYQECASPASRSLPYCDASLPVRDRVESLISSMTVEEKVGQLSPDPSLGNECLTITPGVPRLGLGRYMWLVETNSQANSACMDVATNDNGGTEKRCATAFPGALGLAATFNRSVWSLKGGVISTEMRALNNAGGKRRDFSTQVDPLVGLTGFGPNINVARDPRFGRTSELPGEDPYLNGEYAKAYVTALQEADSKGYVKILAFAKHYTAYSRETDRGSDSYDISPHDLHDTYLPQYEAALVEGGAAGVMCSYNAENGVPSCANDLLLNGVMRERWRRPDAIVFTDCGAVPNMKNYPAAAPDDDAAAAWTIGNGTDVEAGSHLWRDRLPGLVKSGKLDEGVLDAALRRIFVGQMRTGRFDDPSGVEWTKIPPAAIGSDENGAVRDDAAAQAAVLLRNVGGALPLEPGSRVVLVGPTGDDGYAMMPDYFGDEVCVPEPSGNATYGCVPTFLSGLRDHNGPGGSVTFVRGVDERSANRTGYDAALWAVWSGEYDIVVLAMGISKRTEREGTDRVNTTLPGLQDQFARDVLDIATSKGMAAVMILTNGGALSVDGLLPPRDYSNVYDARGGSGDGDAGADADGGGFELPECYRSRRSLGPREAERTFPARYAAVEAYNPSFGAAAVIGALYGVGPVRWGRMVATVYPASWAETHRMDQYDMAADGGRTYRYHGGRGRGGGEEGAVLATFGEGMPSERPGQLKLRCSVSPPPRRQQTQPRDGKRAWNVTCSASNSGTRPASALAMLYVRPSNGVRAAVGDRFPVPLRTLRAFERSVVPPGGTAEVGTLPATVRDLLLVDGDGRRAAVPGSYHLDVWDGWDGFASFEADLTEEDAVAEGALFYPTREG